MSKVQAAAAKTPQPFTKFIFCLKPGLEMLWHLSGIEHAILQRNLRCISSGGHTAKLLRMLQLVCFGLQSKSRVPLDLPHSRQSVELSLLPEAIPLR